MAGARTISTSQQRRGVEEEENVRLSQAAPAHGICEYEDETKYHVHYHVCDDFLFILVFGFFFRNLKKILRYFEIFGYEL